MREIVWLKLTDPDAELPVCPPDADVRVLLPAAEEFSTLRDKLAANGIEAREVPYLAEDETITGNDERGYTVVASECSLTRPLPRRFPPQRGAAAVAARDTYDLLWQIHAPAGPAGETAVPAAELVEEDWLRFLPYPVLNPAQAAALPLILDTDDHLVVVAPTGAGKTVIGMAAALRTVLSQGRKAAWLVPQRSLTDELDRELEAWRREGLRVERLSGEHSVDLRKVREAELWVATTEKFEAMCRASSLREALAEVGCLIVDEIHLLGDTERGPVLEALLARMRGDGTTGSGLRIVGLSATVSNAGQLADWLGARLLRVAWRPSQLTWQLPTIASHRDWSLVETARIRLASSITAMITRDGGSVLVFCGSKRNVRRTALIIAGARGANIDGIHPDNTERLHEVCRLAGVGLHYKGWEHRRQAEADFRARRLDVLVATTTVAAGVNLPARAVVVQDTEVGLSPVDVATVQQMFGRAGRIGAGESQGWSFLLVTEHERASWQAKLVAGHTVRSQIETSLPDHVLAEAVQQRVGSPPEAERWWVGTLAHHQGSRSLKPLRHAVDFLVEADLLTASDVPAGEPRFSPTELGKLTARLMVPATVGHELRLALAEAPLPDSPEEAEMTLIGLVSTLVPKLAQTAINEELKATVTRFLRSDGPTEYQSGDLARAALLLAANHPDAFHRGARTIFGLPYMALYAVLEEAPRYLHWIGCQGLLGTVHPWSAIVAADLSKRIRWRRCQPGRGAGRLLWMCEQMATPAHLEDAVPTLFTAASGRGLTDPDWASRGRPHDCRLPDDDYQALLRDRATGVKIERQTDHVTASGPDGSVLVTWRGSRYARTPMARGEAVTAFAEGDGDPGAAVFTWRGDYQVTGWLGRYLRAG
jgi:ATP-dependent DNA helicase